MYLCFDYKFNFFKVCTTLIIILNGSCCIINNKRVGGPRQAEPIAANPIIEIRCGVYAPHSVRLQTLQNTKGARDWQDTILG